MKKSTFTKISFYETQRIDFNFNEIFNLEERYLEEILDVGIDSLTSEHQDIFDELIKSASDGFLRFMLFVIQRGYFDYSEFLDSGTDVFREAVETYILQRSLTKLPPLSNQVIRYLLVSAINAMESGQSYDFLNGSSGRWGASYETAEDVFFGPTVDELKKLIKIRSLRDAFDLGMMSDEEIGLAVEDLENQIANFVNNNRNLPLEQIINSLKQITEQHILNNPPEIPEPTEEQEQQFYLDQMTGKTNYEGIDEYLKNLPRFEEEPQEEQPQGADSLIEIIKKYFSNFIKSIYSKFRKQVQKEQQVSEQIQEESEPEEVFQSLKYYHLYGSPIKGRSDEKAISERVNKIIGIKKERDLLSTEDIQKVRDEIMSVPYDELIMINPEEYLTSIDDIDDFAEYNWRGTYNTFSNVEDYYTSAVNEILDENVPEGITEYYQSLYRNPNYDPDSLDDDAEGEFREFDDLNQEEKDSIEKDMETYNKSIIESALAEDYQSYVTEVTEIRNNELEILEQEYGFRHQLFLNFGRDRDELVVLFTEHLEESIIKLIENGTLSIKDIYLGNTEKFYNIAKQLIQENPYYNEFYIYEPGEEDHGEDFDQINRDINFSIENIISRIKIKVQNAIVPQRAEVSKRIGNFIEQNQITIEKFEKYGIILFLPLIDGLFKENPKIQFEIPYGDLIEIRDQNDKFVERTRDKLNQELNLFDFFTTDDLIILIAENLQNLNKNELGYVKHESKLLDTLTVLHPEKYVDIRRFQLKKQFQEFLLRAGSGDPEAYQVWMQLAPYLINAPKQVQEYLLPRHLLDQYMTWVPEIFEDKEEALKSRERINKRNREEAGIEEFDKQKNEDAELNEDKRIAESNKYPNVKMMITSINVRNFK